ncbi:DUF5665 domain-containing protein [Cognatishimia activa]|uniref:Uncharacterized protein n=1 Tax=Cognatishimia activa TaxID=1715691 RepID=A0A975ESF7_9RHOB|nr:DUF5665 domain-containing protein [Cognatishimia activa]QTN37325.1 hypothetical protein HZ995_07465 [Cognatishimia activa]
MDPTSQETLEKLTVEVEKLNQHRFIRIQNSVWRMMLFQLGRGLAFGLGSVLGATIVVSILAWFISQIEFIPLIGNWASEILKQIDTTQ